MSKEKKRHRSRSPSKKHKKRRHSSSSSASSDDVKDEFQLKLDRERAEKKRQRKAEKERLKEKETPEEKRARRMAKKLQKKEKKAKDNESYIPPQLAYTNLNNPFNDTKLTETFVWGKKLDQEGKSSLSKKEIEKEIRHRAVNNLREMELLKQARDARLAAREDRDMIQRDMDRRSNADWDMKERQFQLEQAKVRSRLRIDQNRAKPIDLLYRYIHFGDEEDEEKKDDDEFELNHPLTFLKDLKQGDFEDLIEDIKVYRSMDGDKHSQYWKDIRCVIDDELKKLHGEGGRTVHNSVQAEMVKMFKGSNVTKLIELEMQISNKVSNPGPGVDVTYWEAVLEYLRIHTAKTRLKELHQSMLKLKLKRIRDENEKELGSIETTVVVPKAVKEEPVPEPSTSKSISVDEEDETDELQKQVRRKVDVNELENPELNEQEVELKWKALDADQLEYVTKELYERGCYSPPYGDFNDTMPGIELFEEDADREDLLKRRMTNGKKTDSLNAVDAAMMAIAKKGMDKDESTFAVEQKIDTQDLLWSDKYRPRKPTYLNRVQTGFDWNKYNQTHYDLDNPPPKLVQGYKFNIFYPDLLNKRETPSFTVTPCDDKDFAVIRFKSGPPYEDIAFKVVNREWEVSHRNGYKCQFQNGVFQLWFQFKKYRYRR